MNLPLFAKRFFLSLFAAMIFTTVGAFAQQPKTSASPANSAPATLVRPAQVPAASSIAEPDIRDIRGPISIPSPWRWLWLAGGIVLALAAIYFAWRWYREFAATKTKQPFELALARLENARRLMTPEQAREYSFAVSEITRDYIETRFRERAAHRTTDEFLRHLVAQTDSPLAAHRPLLEDFLRYCDLAKFARWELDLPQMESMHESARNFILATKPAPESAKTIRHSKNGTAPHLPTVRAQFLQPIAKS
ncbi:MAG: DUF4381 family protein [Verrucomicrobiota bacterium]|nr:DUF4381 family protein [Verrucomicrobiota bacterium]